MGRLIDVSELHNTVMLNKSEWGIFATPIDRLIESLVSQVSTADAIPKADYENRLNADMVDMLTDIWLEIKKKSYYDTTIIGNYEDEVRINLVELDDVNEIIQQKIHALKSESEEK